MGHRVAKRTVMRRRGGESASGGAEWLRAARWIVSPPEPGERPIGFERRPSGRSGRSILTVALTATRAGGAESLAAAANRAKGLPVASAWGSGADAGPLGGALGEQAPKRGSNGTVGRNLVMEAA